MTKPSDQARSAGAPAPDGRLKSVSRLPPLGDAWDDPTLQAVFNDTLSRGGSVLNLHLATGHAPRIAKARRALAHSLRNEAKTSRLLRELAIVRTAQLAASDYELNQHLPLALASGLTQRQIGDIERWKGSELFNEKQKALLAYVDEVIAGGNVSDKTFAALAGYFTPEEIVEITVTATHYYANCLLTKSLGIQVETDGRAAAPGKMD